MASRVSTPCWRHRHNHSSSRCTPRPPRCRPNWPRRLPPSARWPRIWREKSGGKLVFEEMDPVTAADATVTAQTLAQTYGIQPIPTSLFGTDSFYLHMVLEPSDSYRPGAQQGAARAQVIYPQNDMSEAAVREAIEAAALRTSTGFSKVVGLWTPPAAGQPDMFGQTQPPVQSYTLLRNQLSQEYAVRDVDLADGQPPAGVDVLLLVAPQNMTDQQRFAVDQFLMRGGAVVVLAGNYAVAQDAQRRATGAAAVSGHAGRSTAALWRGRAADAGTGRTEPAVPVPGHAQCGRHPGARRSRRVDYPSLWTCARMRWIRRQASRATSPTSRSTGRSPVVITTTLPLRSRDHTAAVEPKAWLRSDTNIQPDFERYPGSGFGVEGELGVQPLAASLQGAVLQLFCGQAEPTDPKPRAAAAPGVESSAPLTATGATATSELGASSADRHAAAAGSRQRAAGGRGQQRVCRRCRAGAGGQPGGRPGAEQRAARAERRRLGGGRYGPPQPAQPGTGDAPARTVERDHSSSSGNC